MTRLVHMAFD